MSKDSIKPETATTISTPKFCELSIAEEYFRPGVWKIYYRVRGVDYMHKGMSWHNQPYEFDTGPDEIKFSGKDAKERALAVFEAMAHEKE